MPTRGLAVVIGQGSATPLEVLSSLYPSIPVTFIADAAIPRGGVVPELSGMASLLVNSTGYQALLREVRSTRPAGITTFSDAMLPVTARLAHDLGLPYHSRKSAELLTDKHAQRRRLASAGLDSVRCCTFSNFNQWRQAATEVGFPMVVKPVRGMGSKHTHPVADERSGERLVSLLFADTSHPTNELTFIAEEFLQGRNTHPFGDYVSVESLVQDGRVTHIAVTGKFPQRPLSEKWETSGRRTARRPSSPQFANLPKARSGRWGSPSGSATQRSS